MDKTKFIVVAVIVVAVIIACIFVVIDRNSVPPEGQYFSELETTDKVLEVDDVEYAVVSSQMFHPILPASEVTVYYSDGLFATDASEYNSHLATTSFVMASTGFAGGAMEVKDQAEMFIQFCKLLGFENVYVNESFQSTPGEFTIGTAMASKTIEVGGEKKTLIPVIMRSSNYGLEWVSNFTLGTSGEALGFATAADQVFEEIKQYMEDNGIDGYSDDTLFWVTGYSRGAATANLLSKRLVDEYDNGGTHTFCYTYETPCGGVESELKEGCNYNCIHNVYDRRDLVVFVAPTQMGFMHYGVDHFAPGTDVGEIYESVTEISGAGDVTTVTQLVDNFDGWKVLKYPNQDRYEDYLFDCFGMLDHKAFKPSILTPDGEYTQLSEEYDLNLWLWNMFNDILVWTETDREAYAGGDGVNLQQCLQSIMRSLNSSSSSDTLDYSETLSKLGSMISTDMTDEEIEVMVKTLVELANLEELQKQGLTEEESEFLAELMFTIASHDLIQTYEKTGQVGFMYMGTLSNNTLELVLYHIPTYLAAWLMTEDSFY